MSDPKIIMSPLCREIVEDGTKIQIDIYRGENELTRRTQGTGIGLALVKGLAEEMGARLHVGNAEGGGFRAVLELSAA